MPKEFSHFLVANNTIPALLAILEHQIHIINVIKANQYEDIISSLIVLKTIIETNRLGLEIIFQYIFPCTDNEKSNQKNQMKPEDAPKGTLRWHLIQLMKNTNTVIQTIVTEFLWNICNKNTSLFIRKVGLGNGFGFPC